MLLGKKREGLWGRGSTQQKFPKDTALHTLTFPEIGHRFDSLEKQHGRSRGRKAAGTY